MFNNKKFMNEMNKIIDEININKKFYYINNLYDKLFKNDKNIIKYKIKNGDKKIKIFGINSLIIIKIIAV